MKKLGKLGIVLLAVMLLLSSMPVSASAANIAYGAATVTASALNIRTGPGTSYSRAGLIYRNSRLVVLETTTANWYKINYEGIEGYVHTAYLKDVLTAENFNATGTLTANKVRIRAGHSTSTDILGMVNKGDTVQVIGINSGWYKIKLRGITGYIRSDLMTVTGAPGSVEDTLPQGSELGKKIAELALTFEGYDYIYGAESPADGFDCSGLVYYCYGQYGIEVPRTAGRQYSYSECKTVYKSDLQPGDLVFFSNDGGASVTHVGIYIGDGNFIHASNSRTGVKISSLYSSYYLSVWYGAKRLV